MEFGEGLQARVLEGVRGGSADFGFGDAAEVGGPLDIDASGEHGFGVAFPEGYAMARRKFVALGDLACERMISMPKKRLRGERSTLPPLPQA